MREEVLDVLSGAIVAAIGLAGYLLLYWAIVARLEADRSLVERDGSLIFLAVIGVLATAFFLPGIRLIRRGFRDLRDAPSQAQVAVRPWLKRKTWRRREIVSGSPVGYPFLLLAYLFFGLPALLFFWMAIAGPDDTNAILRIEYLLLGLLLVFIVGGLTYWRLRQTRYGNSVCRLFTLPGVVGGWFKADVECRLPADADSSVVVRLRNFVLRGKRMVEVWRMEQRLAVPVTTGIRSTVPVRLRIPRDPAQRPMLVGDDFWEADSKSWVLEVEKHVPGIDFFVAFRVPIYDTPDAPAAEQAAGGEAAGRRVAQPAAVAVGRNQAPAWLVASAVVAVAAGLAVYYAYHAVPRSPWMTSAEHQREFDARAKKGFYPHEVDGQCQSDGERFRAEWRTIPSGTSFLAHHGMTGQDHARRNQDYAAKGYVLVSVRHFRDCAGLDRYQATWLKR